MNANAALDLQKLKKSADQLLKDQYEDYSLEPGIIFEQIQKTLQSIQNKTFSMSFDSKNHTVRVQRVA